MTRFTVAIQRYREGTQRDILEREGEGRLGKTWRDWMMEGKRRISLGDGKSGKEFDGNSEEKGGRGGNKVVGGDKMGLTMWRSL